MPAPAGGSHRRGGEDCKRDRRNARMHSRVRWYHRMSFNRIGIVGGGAWGTALAITQCRAGRDVLLWAREAEVVEDVAIRHRNTAFLPGIDLDPAIAATAELADLATRDLLLLVSPAQALRAVAGRLASSLPAKVP